MLDANSIQNCPIVVGSDGRSYYLIYTNKDGSQYGYPVAYIDERVRHAGRHHRHHRHPAASASSSAMTYSKAGETARRYAALANDPWQGNEFARELFQGQGAHYWIDANNGVQTMTVIFTAEYLAAFFAPEILEAMGFSSRWALNRVGAFGPTVNRLFWSGGGYWMAQRYIGGVSSIGQTLEDSFIGSFAGSLQEFLPETEFTGWMWGYLSRGFAEGAEGTAQFFEGVGGYTGFAWSTFEETTLERLGTSITRIPYPVWPD